MAWTTTRVKALLDAGWKVYTADEARPEHEAWTRRMQPPKGQRTRPSVDRQKTSQSFPDALPDQQNSHAVPDRAEPEHRADDPRTGPAPTRNRHRQDRGRPGQRTPPPRQSPDRPPRARPAAGAHHTDPSAAVRARPPTRPVTSGTRPRTTPPPSSTRHPKKPSARPPHTSPAAPSTTTSNTSPPRETETILFHDSHMSFGLI